MVLYGCTKCNKVFNRKSNYDSHVNKRKYPCNKLTILTPPNSAKLPIDDIKKQDTNDNKRICTYCNKNFTRIDSLQKHLRSRCKLKTNHDEFEKLKNEMKVMMEKHIKIEHENENLIKKIKELEKIKKDV